MTRDLVAVLPAGGVKAKDAALKAFIAGAVTSTGLDSATDPSATTRGVKRTAVLSYPTTYGSGILRPGVLIEMGTRGGALPQRRLSVQSLITEHAESIGLPVDFAESQPVSILVLEPIRTLVDKLMLLHHAATEGDAQRQAATARHYYDVDRLLRNDDVISQLSEPPVDVLAREVTEHSRAAGLPTVDRPKGGFAASPAWDATAAKPAADAYHDIVLANLVWGGAPRSDFESCCAHVHELAHLL